MWCSINTSCVLLLLRVLPDYIQAGVSKLHGLHSDGPPTDPFCVSAAGGFDNAGYGYGGYGPYGGYNMSAGPGFYPGAYAPAPPGYAYPQYGQPPVGGGAFQQAGAYGGAQPHLGGGSAAKYGGAGYGVPCQIPTLVSMRARRVFNGLCCCKYPATSAEAHAQIVLVPCSWGLVFTLQNPHAADSSMT